MEYKKTTLQNGLKVITIPMQNSPAVIVYVMVHAGSEYESKDINGLSHFLEHMVFKGTPKRPKAKDIAKELDAIGADYNAFTSQEYTGYYAKVSVKHLDIALDVISDMYLNPLFEEGEIEKEKGVIIEEIKMYKDQPQKHVHELMAELLYGDQPAGRPVVGPIENIRRFNRNDFVEYRKKHYHTDGTTVVVAGGFDEEEVIRKVEKAFLNIQVGKKPDKPRIKEEQNSPKIKLGFKETDQSHLVISFRSFSLFDKRISAMRVLSTILAGGMSSRLFSKMRDELGICYYISAAQSSSTDHGDFSVWAGVDNKRIEEAIREILVELKSIKEEGVSHEELKRAKDCMAGSLLLGLETSGDQADYIGTQELFKNHADSPEERINQINNVTKEDVQNLAKEIFVEENLNLAIIGPYKEEEGFRKLLTFKL